MPSKHPGEELLTTEQWQALSAKFRLTKRELSVAMLIFEGETRRQIARRLGCAPATVRTYIDRLFAKLHVTDRLGMVLRIMRALLALGLTAIVALLCDLSDAGHRSYSSGPCLRVQSGSVSLTAQTHLT